MNYLISKSAFYSEIASLLQTEINDETIFFDEIGLSGVDAGEFVMFIHRQFKVDFSAFDYKKYYVADGDNFVRLLLDPLYKTKKIPIKHFTAEYLYEIVKSGVWVDPM
jgi:hypothetical protein